MSSESKPTANMYEEVGDVLGSDRTLEETLAATRGGEAWEWMPDVERIRDALAEGITTGNMPFLIPPEPEADGIFAGLFRALQLHIQPDAENNPTLSYRVVYLSPEQYQTGKFSIPVEGFFAVDCEEITTNRIV